MTAGRVLITGATGFVGRALAAHLSGAGRPLTLAVRAAAAPLVADPRVRQVAIGEIGPGTDWREALGGVAAIVHLGGLAHVSDRSGPAGENLHDRVNRAGSVRLYEQAAEAGVARFVFLSSITVLGGRTRGRPFDDASPPDPRSAYARSKLAAETALSAGARAGGPALTVLRPPLVCGAGVKGNLASLLRLLDTPLPVPLGAIRNRRTLLSLDNLVSAIAAVLAAPGPAGVGVETFVLGDRAPVSTTTVAASLREGLGRPRRLVAAPDAILTLMAAAAGRGGAARRLLGDLEVDSGGFRRAFGWSDVAETRASLVEAGRAWRSGRRPDRASATGSRVGPVGLVR